MEQNINDDDITTGIIFVHGGPVGRLTGQDSRVQFPRPLDRLDAAQTGHPAQRSRIHVVTGERGEKRMVTEITKQGHSRIPGLSPLPGVDGSIELHDHVTGIRPISQFGDGGGQLL